jgi:hypothetical protein
LSSGPAASPKTGVIDGELGDDVVAVADLMCQGCAECNTSCGWIAVIGGSSRMQGQTSQRAHWKMAAIGCGFLGVRRMRNPKFAMLNQIWVSPTVVHPAQRCD